MQQAVSDLKELHKRVDALATADQAKLLHLPRFRMLAKSM